jgi:hypothetical protein
MSAASLFTSHISLLTSHSSLRSDDDGVDRRIVAEVLIILDADGAEFYLFGFACGLRDDVEDAGACLREE